MNNKLLINNFKEKLKNTRELCPGMTDEIYEISEYMASIANDTVKPESIALLIVCILDDISKKKSGFPNAKLPEYLIEHGNQCIAQMQYFPQVIDVIADEEFADSFREICEDKLRMHCPRRVKVSTDNKYPEYIEAAVNWWANAIQSPKMDNGTDILAIFSVMLSKTNKGYTAEEISVFKDTLASGISEELDETGRCLLSVDYEPCKLLKEAGNQIGVGEFGFPIKTTMFLDTYGVVVSEGYQTPSKTIWSKEESKVPQKKKEK